GAGTEYRVLFFVSSTRRHTRCYRDWSSDVCSSDLGVWQIADVYLDGTISEMATRRSEFAAILRAQGITGLIQTLNAKANTLTGEIGRASCRERVSLRVVRAQVGATRHATGDAHLCT